MKPLFSYPPKFEHRDIPCIWQNPDEFEVFCAYAKNYGIAKYLEVGIGYGLTLTYMKYEIGLEAYGVDVEPMLKGDNIFKGDSHSKEALDWVDERGPFDLIFIDADHTYEATKQDFELYYPRARTILAIHDICANDSEPYPTDPGVKKFWDELKVKESKVEIKSVDREQAYGIGLILK